MWKKVKSKIELLKAVHISHAHVGLGRVDPTDAVLQAGVPNKNDTYIGVQ